MTDARRAAIGEDIRIIGLLVEARTPHARELAAIVAMRIGILAADANPEEPDLPTDEEIQMWAEFSRALELQFPPAEFPKARLN